MLAFMNSPFSRPTLWLLVWLGAALLFTGCAGNHPPSQQPRPMPVLKNGARVLFQGDSITDGNRGRSADPNHILGHGYQALIGSRFGADHPERQVLFINRGISGHKVVDLARRWQSDTIDLKPDLLSILIGINDLDGGVSPVDFERQYDALLSQTVKALPETRLVLCEPFGLPVGPRSAKATEFRSDLEARQQAVRRLATKYHAALVPFQAVFDDACRRAPTSHWIWDGIHPTYAGHQIMADAWVRVVRELPPR